MLNKLIIRWLVYRGDALDDVEVIGVVTWLVNRTRDDEAPAM